MSAATETRTKASVDGALQLLVDDLIASFDEATGTWHPSWHNAGLFPHNALTGVNYRGINTLMLWAAQVKRHYQRPVWATFKQWLELGAQVRKGEHSTWGVKWVEVPTKADPDKTRLVPKVFHVFNVEQVDGADAIGEAAPVPAADWWPGWETFIEPIPAVVTVGSPCYMPGFDVIQMPPAANFVTIDDYVFTFAHELGHWTGAKSRLDRKRPDRMEVIDPYAYEELVAEISASLTAAFLQVPGTHTREDHVHYIKGWLTALKMDPSILLRAAQDAQRATDHLVAYSAPKEQPCAPNPG